MMQLITTNIKFLLKLGNINCFFPYYDQKTEEFKIRPLYQATVLTIYLLAYIYMFYIKITLEGELLPDRGPLLIITSGILAFLGGFWLLRINTKKRIAKVQSYFDTFEEIDRNLSAIFRIKINDVKHVNLYAPAILVVHLIGITIAFYLWGSDTDNIQYRVHFIADIFIIMGHLVCALIAIYTLECMKRRYDVLAGIVGILGLDREQIAVTSYRIDCLSRLHNAISDLVILFNGLFSWKILGLILYTVVVDLMTLGFLVTGYYKQNIKIFICVVGWTFMITMHVVVVAVMCERVVDAGKKNIVVTYKAMYRLSGSVPLRAKIIILGSQMEARCPKFTAAGFFGVDFAMMFTFVNLMVTYIIVIIQFANNN